MIGQSNTKKTLRLGVTLAAFLTVFPAMTAQAQFVAGSGVPAKISADSVEYKGNVTYLSGQVDVRQEDVRILSDEMAVYSAKGSDLSNTDISKVVADGNFYYLTNEQEVRGAKGVYTRTDDTFVVTGDVILKQSDGNVVTGDTLYYNISTKHARVVGTCKGRKCGSRGRVNILIRNNQNTN